MKKSRLIFSIIIFILIINSFALVKSETLISDAGVEYNSEIRGQFIWNKWIPVNVELNDTSGIIISAEDSIELQKSKDAERNSILISITNEVLSDLSAEEFQLKSKSEFGGYFAGNVTKEGFNKLITDQRVKAIYDNSAKGKIHLDNSVFSSWGKILILSFLFIVGTIILLIKFKKKKQK